jgi:hypothetical protein
VTKLASAGRLIVVLGAVGLDARSMPLRAGLVPEGGEVVLVVVLSGGWVTLSPQEPWPALCGLLPRERLQEQQTKLLPVRSGESRTIRHVQQQWLPLHDTYDFWKEGGGVL